MPKINKKKTEYEELIDFLGVQFSKIDDRFSKIDDRFSKIDDRFSKIDDRFSKMDKRFDKIESTMATKDDLKLLEARLDKKIDTVREDVELRISAFSRFMKIEIDDIKHRLDEIQRDTDAYSKDIVELRTRVEKLEKQLKTIQKVK